MPTVKVDSEKCKGCLLCIHVCPKGSLGSDSKLNRKGFKPVKVKDASRCLGCALCAIICPDCCIEVYK